MPIIGFITQARHNRPLDKYCNFYAINKSHKKDLTVKKSSIMWGLPVIQAFFQETH